MYESKNLSVLSYANGFTEWHYVSATDTAAQVVAPGYFNDAHGMLRKNDAVHLHATDGALLAYVGTANAGAVSLVPPMLWPNPEAA